MPAKTVEVSVPEYTIAREPDYASIGTKVDRAIETSFPDGTYILRAIGVDDHPGLTVDELTQMILTTGTDKYDPRRESVGSVEFSGYDYDIQAGPVRIRDSRMVIEASERFPTVFGGIVWHFYNGALLDRGHPIRIDILMLYDPRSLTRARKVNPQAKGVRKGLSQHLYKFRAPGDKKSALLGVVKILR
jgi:hypothetical protein